MKILAPAKINLGLEIGKKNVKGYHEVDMIMQSISLCDEIDLSFSSDGKISLSTDKEINCSTENNIAYKAAKYFFEYTKISSRGINIKIKKNIPMCAGLAGGSTDGAAVIFGLDKMFETHLSIPKMCKIGSGVGSDVPFCIIGGAAAAKGTGTDLIPTYSMPNCSILVVKPNVSISTAEAYSRFDDIRVAKKHHMESLKMALELQSLQSICDNLFNRFEEVINNEKIFEIKQKLHNFGAMGSLMTGSGSAVYGIFNDMNKAENCLKFCQNMYDFACITRPLSHGAYLI
ncbi:MAG: 4-(cytidine 5'-diphospho)-2-C-methyl-D-erythritol kinase [Clostridia bacterium]|nr:4-(cytidine 5'-diphospho)-2-C-methyl-D-erythritol kinase [Clostridia bacterium]